MKTKLIALTLYFILAVSFIGCGIDNDTIIKEQVSKAEELKESCKESEAMKVLLNASSRIDGQTPLALQTKIYSELGALYYDRHKLEDAGRYFKKAIDVARAHDSISSYPNLLWNLVLTVNDLDSAKAIMSECRDLCDRDREQFDFLAIRSRLALAKIYTMDNNMEIARSILDSVSSIAQLNNILKFESIQERAILYLAEDDLPNGIRLIKEQPLDSLSLDGKTERYQLLYKAYKEMGDYQSALSYRDSLAICTDSVQSIKSSEEISRIEREYNQKIAKEERERNAIIYAGSAFVILLMVIALLLNRSRRIKARQVSLMEQISRLNIELSRLKDNADNYGTEDKKDDVVISKLQLSKELFTTLPSHRLIAQANLERNAEDISKEIQKDLYDSLVAQFSDVCNNLKDAYPALSSEDMMLCIMTYVGLNKDVISVLLKSSDDALRQRKSRLKKKIPIGLVDLFFCKPM